MYETFKTPFHASTWDLQNQQDDGSIGKRSVGKEIGEKKQSMSKPAIAGLVVFLVLLVSALLMFFFYRRRKSSKNKTLRSPPPQVVRQDVITVPTETVHLASQGSPRPIPAAPDYGSVGIARRLSRKDVLEGSSSSEEEARESDNNGVLQKYDWSSPRRTKSEDRAKAAGPMKGDENANEDKVAEASSADEEVGYPADHTGRIWFQVDYQSLTEKLEVTVFNVRNLPLRKNASSPPDPLVRLYLLPDDRCQHQTESKRRTQHPNFGQSFNFQVARDNLPQRVLRLSVYDLGKGRRSDVIGHVLYSLKDQALGVKAWRDLETVSEVESKLGDLHVSLGYYPVLSRLSVIVLRATNLPLQKGRHDPDTYVKVTFSKGNKVLTVKKTGVKQGTSEPFFNESFNITTTMDDLPSCSLLLSVYLSTGNDSEGEDGNLIGRVLLGGMMYARGKELEHWTEMICQPRTIVKYWHSLAR